MQLDLTDAIKAIPFAVVAVIAGFVKLEHSKISKGISSKADKEQTEKEINSLKEELNVARAAHEREMERMERLSADKINAVQESITGRIEMMERGLNEKLALMLEMMRRNP